MRPPVSCLRKGAVKRGEADIVTSQGAYGAGRKGIEDRGQGRLRGLMQGYEAGRKDLAGQTNQNLGTLAGLSGANVAQMGGLADTARQGVTDRYAKDQAALQKGYGGFGQGMASKIAGDTSALDTAHSARMQGLGQGYTDADKSLAGIYGAGRGTLKSNYGDAATEAGKRYGGRLQAGLGMLNQFGAGAKADILQRMGDQQKAGFADVEADANRRGLGNTTIRQSGRAGIREAGFRSERAIRHPRGAPQYHQTLPYAQFGPDRRAAGAGTRRVSGRSAKKRDDPRHRTTEASETAGTDECAQAAF